MVAEKIEIASDNTKLLCGNAGVRFGGSLDLEAAERCTLKPGDDVLKCKFRAAHTFARSDGWARVEGKTTYGEPIVGIDSVRIVP